MIVSVNRQIKEETDEKLNDFQGSFIIITSQRNSI